MEELHKSCVVVPFMRNVYQSAADDVATYDQLIRDKAATILDKLQGIQVLIGIPYYTELSNVVSVCVCLREAVRQERIKTLIVVLGEFSRSDMVEKLQEADLNHDEDLPNVEAFWKPALRYQQKPWSVRAFQILAAMANDGNGAHMMIVDADIQFNFWDVSARSLCNALITPLDQLPAAMVCLNAPRSFYADDAIVHLWCFLFTYAIYGVRIHQLHGGEFSLHRDLNLDLIHDKTMQHDSAYCLQGQITARTLLSPQYGAVLERRMKGKWHAKITLSKLVHPDPVSGRSRMDMVTERMFQDALLLGDAAVRATDAFKVEYVGQSEAEAHRMSVLAPGPARRELARTIMALYTADGDVLKSTLKDLPTMADVVLPLASRMTTNTDISGLGAPGAECFTHEHWAKATFELLHCYKNAPTDAVRIAVIHGNRLAWLLGAIAFMKDNSQTDWHAMHHDMWDRIAPEFRRVYLDMV